MANLTPPRLQTRAPLVTDDSTAGVWLGMVWIDTVAKKAYVAVSIAVGAAVWTALGAALFTVYTTTSGLSYDSVTLLNTTTTPAFDRTSNGTIGGP